MITRRISVVRMRTGLTTERWVIATLKSQREEEGPTKEIRIKKPVIQEENRRMWCPGSQAKQVCQKEGMLNCAECC